MTRYAMYCYLVLHFRQTVFADPVAFEENLLSHVSRLKKLHRMQLKRCAAQRPEGGGGGHPAALLEVHEKRHVPARAVPAAAMGALPGRRQLLQPLAQHLFQLIRPLSDRRDVYSD